MQLLHICYKCMVSCEHILVPYTPFYTHSILTAIFPGEPGLAGCPFNSPPFIPGLRILLGHT